MANVRSHQSERLLYEITITTGTDSGTITATDEHPFWVDNLNTWVTAEDLKPGYTFTTADNRPATVTGTRPFADSRLVYNLTVNELHTYYVGVSGTSSTNTADVLVHNEDENGLDPCPTDGQMTADSMDIHNAVKINKKTSIGEKIAHQGMTVATGGTRWPQGLHRQQEADESSDPRSSRPIGL